LPKPFNVPVKLPDPERLLMFMVWLKLPAVKVTYPVVDPVTMQLQPIETVIVEDGGV
jgi:hypothetical protein